MEDGGASTTAAGAGDVDVVVEGLEKGELKPDVGFFPCSPMFDTFGADVDAAKGEKDKTSVEPEALGTEEVELDPDAKAEVKLCC